MKKLKSLVLAASALILCAGLFTGCGGTDSNGNSGGNSENSAGGTSVCAHTELTKVEGKDPTCYDYGNSVYYECECGALFSDKNGKRPTTLEDVRINKLRHDMYQYDGQIGEHVGHYFCNSCLRYYEDRAGEKEIVTDSYMTPVTLFNNWTDSAGASAENRDFTIRCFIGWTNSAGKTFADFPDSYTIQVNVNLNRKCTIQNTGWYNFGVAYNKAAGLQYKDFEAGHLTPVAEEFTNLFTEQGGIWVRVVRKGTNCWLYFEDKNGVPVLISNNDGFGADEALYRFAYGVPTEQTNVGAVPGWTQSDAKGVICWGIANPRYAFG